MADTLEDTASVFCAQEYPILERDAFVRSLRVDRDTPHAFFLGAGASLSSGVPTAATCIWEWKRAVFATRNPGLQDRVAELSLPSVRDRIDRWLAANGHVPQPGEDEYGYYIEKCLPIGDNRRGFFAERIRKARPHVGYELLCLLAEAGIISSTWTTNFDGLTARAARAFSLIPIEIGIECAERIFRQPRKNELVCVSLHGDYRYDALKNTSDELKTQDATLRAAFVEVLRDSSLVVMGYSGRDQSVMDALRDGAINSAGRGKIFWCGYADEPEETVRRFIADARAAKRAAYFVPRCPFDDTMVRLALHCLDGDAVARAKQIIGERHSIVPFRPATFEISNASPTSILKSNAWRLKLPAEVFHFDLLEWPKQKVWKWLSETTSGRNIVAVPFREVLALGTLDEIRDCFAGLIKGEIKRGAIADDDLAVEDGAVMHLMRRALVRSIAAKADLLTDGDTQVWEHRVKQRERDNERYFGVHDAAHISLRRVANEMHMVLEPTIHVDGDPVRDADAMRNIRLRILGYQHNKEYNADLNRWRDRLLHRNQLNVYDFPYGTAAFNFEIPSAPVFVSVAQPGKPAIDLGTDLAKLIRYKGTVVPEPRLIFGIDRGVVRSDTMPLRGLAQFGPFDQDATSGLLENSLPIGVICPKAESRSLYDFLASGTKPQAPRRGEKEEYMVQFPAFEAAYRIPLIVPQSNDPAWHTLSEIPNGATQKEGSLFLARSIRDGLASLAATGLRQVVILMPTRWNRWRGFDDESESFDVHDWVKAYCVRQGIATQFLDQDTLTYTDQCRIWWWLSVALYAKAMRTPWALDGLDPGTAFVGLGYAVRKHASNGNRLVLGCSHLYNAQGQGLQFRLSQIENPFFVGRSPFMSFEDARKVGDTIRTLFWESHSRLPERVVIHKLTPFRDVEQKGLRAGLQGVDRLELIEINHEGALRYISSKKEGQRFEDSMFPVRRGTVVKLADSEALLWIHGSTDGVKPNWTYFQGKRRIPGPVVIRRYAGDSDLTILASEMLGLSKMDWNSGDLYSQLPATVESSRRIARIGKLLERFGDRSYDYRLFM